VNEKYLTDIKSHWEDPETESLKDKNLQVIERSTIIEHLEKIKVSRLADFGCGNCEDTTHFSNYANLVDAFDYSGKMIKKASNTINANEKNNISLFKLDLINDQINNSYDTVITKRTLINLGNFENQKNTIVKICESLDNDGHYLMLECSKDGLDNMNSMRKIFSLDDIPMPFHNSHFRLEDLIDFVEMYFEVISTRFFSDYFFLTRVVGPLLNKEQPYRYDNLFKELSSFQLINRQIGPQFFLVLKKK
tara:strand:+ start:211 stop:957 length:747 start_codon:yes stop_codon:yes gene_type:complete